ncbi:MAG: hypothetical protein AAF194_09465 [Pseudomonadota bacterium]
MFSRHMAYAVSLGSLNGTAMLDALIPQSEAAWSATQGQGKHLAI